MERTVGMGYSEIQSKRSASTSKTSKISKKVRFSKKKQKNTFLNYKDKNKIFIKIYLQRKLLLTALGMLEISTQIPLMHLKEALV